MSLQANCSRFCAVETLPILGFASEDTLGLVASYCVAFAIAKENKTHAIGELFIKLYALNMVELVCEREHNKKLRKDYLPNSSLRCCTSVVSCDIHLDHVAD